MKAEEIDAMAQAVSAQTKQLRTELDETILGFGDLHHELIEEKVKYWDSVMLTTRLRDEIREKDKLLKELAAALETARDYMFIEEATPLESIRADKDRRMVDDLLARAAGLLE